MANKRDTSKQKRARENRAQREARKARAEAAAVAPEERRSKATATAQASSSKGGTKASRAAERSARTRPVRPGDVPVDLATLEGNPISKRNHVPGGRQVMFAFVITVVSAITLGVGSYPPADDPDGERTLSFFEAAGGAAIPLLVLPPLIALIAVVLTLHPKHRRIWTIAAAALGAITVAALAIYTVNLLALGFLIYGIQRASKVEGPAPGSRAAKLAAQRQADASPNDAPAEPEA